MTQTLTPQPVMAMTVSNFRSGVRLHIFPMTSVNAARAEFGATLADARDFVMGTTCNECGVEKSAALVTDRACHGCSKQGCDCVLTEDPHERDTFWCEDCQPMCLCTACDPDGYDY